jgi:diadenosine tetraphosphate (Ap4A) HIT family hydrolase
MSTMVDTVMDPVDYGVPVTMPEGDAPDWRQDRIGSAERGKNPTVLARMRTGWAVIGDIQHLPGYSLLLYAGTADQLTDLPRPERVRFLDDVALLGEAVQRACSTLDPAFRRINYEILGNSWPHLHAHVHARYNWEPEALRAGPVWCYGAARLAEEFALGPRHERLRAAIAAELQQVMR